MHDLLALHIPTLIESDRSSPAAVHNGSGPRSQAKTSDGKTTAEAVVTPHLAVARGDNQLVFEGRLAEDPALQQAGTGRLYCRVAALQDQPDRNGQPGPRP